MNRFLRKLYRKTKSFIRYAGGKGVWIKRDVVRPSVFIGSDYGGWAVCPSLFKKESIVYSAGVGEDISFDIGLFERFDVVVHGFDPTPASVEFIKKNPPHGSFIFHQYGVGSKDEMKAFFAPENPEYASWSSISKMGSETNMESFEVKCLQTIMSELDHVEVDLLKMDIEGMEYEVIDYIIQMRILPRQLLVEFHDRNPGIGKEKTLNAVKKLRMAGYKVFSVSPTQQEVSFLLENE